MTIRPDLLLAHAFPEQRQVYDARDAILYALGLGLGRQPDDLPFLDETQLAVLPSFAITLASPGMWIRDPAFGIDFSRLVHSAQDVTFNAPLPASGEVVGSARVESIADRGAGRGAELVLRREIRDARDGTLHASVRQTLLLRADGGFGGEPATRAPSSIPQRPADTVADLALSERAALIYRLSGDRNPLHIDPDFARSAGFDRPILHGLCTYAAAGVAVARAAGASPLAITRLAARFSAIVYPGETLRLSMWHEAGHIAFTAQVGDRKVLDSGILELTV